MIDTRKMLDNLLLRWEKQPGTMLFGTSRTCEEVARWIRASHEWRCTKCGAQADEAWDCCEAHSATGKIVPDQEKIESAAGILTRELGTDRHIALALARRMYDIWHPRVQVIDLAPGAVAQMRRERYELSPGDYVVVPPLED